jgi:hypothetical protein
MKEILLNAEEFILFNDDDQFGFFYDDHGYPAKDASDKFLDHVADLFKKYQYISIDAQDNIYGVINDKKVLLFKEVFEAYDIANEVKTG